jgi:hypothetical protein
MERGHPAGASVASLLKREIERERDRDREREREGGRGVLRGRERECRQI